jgi:hypothetical protein
MHVLNTFLCKTQQNYCLYIFPPMGTALLKENIVLSHLRYVTSRAVCYTLNIFVNY